jgi:hypothetical protein
MQKVAENNYQRNTVIKFLFNNICIVLFVKNENIFFSIKIAYFNEMHGIKILFTNFI